MANLKLGVVLDDRPVKLSIELSAATHRFGERHLAHYGGILQADAYAGFNGLYAPYAYRIIKRCVRNFKCTPASHRAALIQAILLLKNYPATCGW